MGGRVTPIVESGHMEQERINLPTEFWGAGIAFENGLEER